MEDRLKLAIQKSGRLSEKSIELLKRSGIHFELARGKLIARCEDFPLDLLLVRDDDIPGYVESNACDVGIVGYNEVDERIFSLKTSPKTKVVRKLDYGKCRLSIAVPNSCEYRGVDWLDGKRIATSYPNSLGFFLRENNISAEIVEISGSVEIATGMGVAEAICDLVSTGSTLASNSLIEVETIFESEAVVIGSSKLSKKKSDILTRLLTRIDGVQKALRSKYIMMNAPKTALEQIKSMVPGLEEPTVMPLAGSDNRVAVHVVAPEQIFWETMENLKKAGASSILVVPIEKILD